MIGGAVLAAGASRRLGAPKQLLRVHGESFVHYAARCALGSVDRTAVVVGSSAEAVVQSVAELPVAVLPNPEWEEGMASSLRVAARWATEARFEALLLLLCDQPALEAGHLEALCARYRVDGAPVASRYDGVIGVPALFPARYFEALGELRGARGAAALLRSAPNVEVIECPALALDVDTEALARSYR